ncbi:MAG: hypothetical protein EA364_02260 [Balneolaceae bacterium]|nr:MAG: hypothetical protein EA364_02260 [Balneolaceae bacterium]
MDNYIIYEIIGYVASVLVAVSLMMSKIVSLRIVNLIGAAIFSLYGILIGSIPVAGMNAFIVLINIYYLYQIFTNREFFRLLKVTPEDHYLLNFIDFYSDEIKKYQPGFDHTPSPGMVCLFILRDMIPAGLLIGNLSNDGVLSMKLDFVIPMYRDFKIGRYVYSDQKSFFRDQGIKEIRSQTGTAIHAEYLIKMGFMPENDQLVFRV